MANAADQVSDVFLTETRIRAARAGRGTVEALVDTPQEQVAIEAGRSRMHLDHSSNCHFILLRTGQGGVAQIVALLRSRVIKGKRAPPEQGPRAGGQAIAPQIAASNSSVVR